MDDPVYDPVTEDITVSNDSKRACIQHLSIESHGDRMLGVLFRAQGEGPHPTAIILHGFPGHDRNLDIAHTLRRGGVNSVVFHYRGTWGSDGQFSFSNMLDDTVAAIEYLRKNNRELSVDKDKIILVGHSMGGWSALMTAIEDGDISCVVNFAGFNLGALKEWVLSKEANMDMARKTIKGLSQSVNAPTIDSLMDEVLQNGDDWNLLRHPLKLSKKSLLLIWAKNDQLSLPVMHFHPMYESLFSAGASDLATHMIDSDHSFSDGRIELQHTIWNWLKKTLMNCCSQQIMKI